MTFEEFHNALRILHSLDRHEIPVILGECDWRDFRQAPYLWFIRAESTKARAVWAAMEKRQAK